MYHPLPEVAEDLALPSFYQLTIPVWVTLPQQALTLTLPQNTPVPKGITSKGKSCGRYKMMMSPWNFKLGGNVSIIVKISEKEYSSPLINNFCWTSQALTPYLSHILHQVILQGYILNKQIKYTTSKRPTV